MIKHCLLVCSLLFIGLNGFAQSIEDSINNNFVDRIVSIISRDCKLNDSIKTELSKYYGTYFSKMRKIIRQTDDKIVRAQKMIELKGPFEKNLREKFGSRVYKRYKKIIDRRFDDRGLSNRITER